MTHQHVHPVLAQSGLPVRCLLAALRDDRNTGSERKRQGGRNPHGVSSSASVRAFSWSEDSKGAPPGYVCLSRLQRYYPCGYISVDRAKSFICTGVAQTIARQARLQELKRKAELKHVAAKE